MSDPLPHPDIRDRHDDSPSVGSRRRTLIPAAIAAVILLAIGILVITSVTDDDQPDYPSGGRFPIELLTLWGVDEEDIVISVDQLVVGQTYCRVSLFEGFTGNWTVTDEPYEEDGEYVVPLQPFGHPESQQELSVFVLGVGPHEDGYQLQDGRVFSGACPDPAALDTRPTNPED